VIGGRRSLRGRKAGDLRVRVERPHAPYFRYAGPGQLVAKPAASRPVTQLDRALARLRAVLFGRPLASEEEIAERLSKKKALAIFSSDAISSSAYATEEILRVLVVGGALAFLLSVEAAIAIAGLLAVVALSYRQVCRAFPNGGGAYAVAKAELTPLLALIAAAALLIDYVMTVAVSTSSAVDQLISIAPDLNSMRIEIAIASITLITIANLRGLRESGNIFAVPTYLFVGMALFVVGSGLFRIATGSVTPWPRQEEALPLGSEAIGLFLLLRAFASGSVAREQRVVVPVPGINRAVVQAVNVGRSIAPEVIAVLISDEPEQTAEIRARWERQLPGVPLVIVESPYRVLIGPLLAYLDVLDQAWPPDKEQPITFVVIPEYVARHWWERMLYNQSARRLRAVLLGRPRTVVVDVPYRREDPLAVEHAR
jgi:hypothetical protein